MVVTKNPDYRRKFRTPRDWRTERKYHHVMKGYNNRMESIQGTASRVKLRHLEAWTEARRASAARYDRLLAGSGVPSQKAMLYSRHVYHVYVIRTANRQLWREALQAQEIQIGIHYPIPVHLQPAYVDLNYTAGDFPHAERAVDQVLSLPMFPELTEEQCEEVSDVVNAFAAQDIVATS